MQVVSMPPSALKPYPNNPRLNASSVDKVAESIRQFGFQQPIVVDADHVVIVGHTRLKAAKKLGLATVPVVVADSLTPEQVKAYRLADNKVSELALWDDEKLSLELSDLSGLGLDMTDFGFDDISTDAGENAGNGDSGADDGESDHIYGEARLRTNAAYNLELFKEIPEDELSQPWGIPILKPVDHVPSHLIDFNRSTYSTDYSAGVHFYIDDYRFERVWNDPTKYVELLKKFDCVFTPDFSLYADMPDAMQLWNVYRSHFFGWLCQREGIKVIPTLQWANESSFNWSFDGIPDGGTVSISTVGMGKRKEDREAFKKSLNRVFQEIHPMRILFYGRVPDYDFGDIEIVKFKNEAFRFGGGK